MSKPRKIGRPVTVPDGHYLTVKLRGDQLRAINRIAGPAPGGRPRVIRQLLDIGIKATKASRSR